jgi:hypothetical protein
LGLQIYYGIPRSSPLHARLTDHLADGQEIIDVHFHE